MAGLKRCPHCGEWFQIPKRNSHKKYCCQECYWDSMRTPVDREQLDHWYNELGETTEQIGRRLGINGRTVRDIMEKLGIPRRDKVDAAIDYERRPFSGDKVEQAYLHGFRIGDLNAGKDLPTSRTIRVRSSTTHPAQVDLICSLFEPYGYVHTRLGTRGETQIECGLDLSFSFLLEKKDEIPSWVPKRRDTFWAFTAGYVDAEGYISIRRNGKHEQSLVEIASCDINILTGLWTGFNERGVRCPPLLLKRRAGTVTRQGRANCDFYRLGIYRRVSLDILFRNLSPYLKHAEKRASLRRAWENVRRLLQ